MIDLWPILYTTYIYIYVYEFNDIGKLASGPTSCHQAAWLANRMAPRWPWHVEWLSRLATHHSKSLKVWKCLAIGKTLCDPGNCCAWWPLHAANWASNTPSRTWRKTFNSGLKDWNSAPKNRWFRKRRKKCETHWVAFFKILQGVC